MKRILFISVLMLYFAVAYSQQWHSFTTGNSPLPSNNITTVYADNTNGIGWIGTDAGLMFFSGSTGLIRVYTVSTDPSVGDNMITDLAYEKTQYGEEVWIGTDNGVSVFNYGVDAVSSATTYNTTNSDEDVKIHRDDIKAVTVDTITGGLRYYPNTETVSVFHGQTWDTLFATDKDPDGNQHLTTDFYTDYPVTDAASSPVDGYTYIATDGGGVARYYYNDDVDAVTGASLVDNWCGLSNNVYAVYVNPEGHQWYGTDYGVSLHTSKSCKDGGSWTSYDTDDGLVNDKVQAIAEDGDGNMWFGTPAGISVFDGVDQWTTYTTDDGLLSNNIIDISIDTINNIVWVGTDAGLNVYGPAYLTVEQFDALHCDLTVYPNPVRTATNITFNQATAAYTTITIRDLTGRVVKNIEAADLPAGSHSYRWNASNQQGQAVDAGIYLLHVVSNGQSFTQKVNVVR